MFSKCVSATRDEPPDKLAARKVKEFYDIRYEKDRSLLLQGKAGPTVELVSDLTLASLMKLWFGLEPVDAATARGAGRLFTKKFSVKSSKAKHFFKNGYVIYGFSDNQWARVRDHISAYLGRPCGDMRPIYAGDLESFILASRAWRATQPSLDAISKRAFLPSQRHTTWNKFGITKGRNVLHIGSGLFGRLSCVGTKHVPIDPLLNDLRWEEVELKGDIVSDVALPNDSKTGMGRDNVLYGVMRQHSSIFKINFQDLEPVDVPIYKAREHNLECIVASPGWGAKAHGAFRTQDIVRHNDMRNELVANPSSFKSNRDKLGLPDDEEIVFPFSWEDVVGHIGTQIQCIEVKQIFNHTVERKLFCHETFMALIECKAKIFCPSIVVSNRVAGRCLRKTNEQLIKYLPYAGLSSSQAATLYLWRNATLGQKQRAEQLYALRNTKLGMIDVEVEIGGRSLLE